MLRHITTAPNHQGYLPWLPVAHSRGMYGQVPSSMDLERHSESSEEVTEPASLLLPHEAEVQ